MADQMRCNVCFRKPGRETSRFSITNCGHVVCEACLQKGKKDECGVCRSPCRTIFLTNETSPDIKILFMDINTLCKNYSKEFTQVMEFQDSHRRRLHAHYKGKIGKLEEKVKELTQELKSLKSLQSYNQLPTSSALLNSENQSVFSPYSHPASQLPNARSVEPMDFAVNTPKKTNFFTIAAPTRLSMISPPHEGCMGQVPYKTKTTVSLRSILGSLQPNTYHQLSQSVSQADRTDRSWDFSSLRTPYQLSQTPVSSQSIKVRQPITLTNILQRRH
ncbi:probable E3 SUMO-protein ligase RNF212 isoform X1 [Pyxicephalus adspersus]|uniref:RING-type domain-containing protein n=1 Tax=Pyxicephalus adspersus TaxID=30357 RepID=A0AAV3B940_PYXAD|nr:TPA: hypothetical protein GDO54_007699 [Pyxicephalus adspersus]